MNALVANLAIGKQAWDVQILMVDTDVIVSKATITKKMTHAKVRVLSVLQTTNKQKLYCMGTTTYRVLYSRFCLFRTEVRASNFTDKLSQ